MSDEPVVIINNTSGKTIRVYVTVELREMYDIVDKGVKRIDRNEIINRKNLSRVIVTITGTPIRD